MSTSRPDRPPLRAGKSRPSSASSAKSSSAKLPASPPSRRKKRGPSSSASPKSKSKKSSDTTSTLFAIAGGSIFMVVLLLGGAYLVSTSGALGPSGPPAEVKLASFETLPPAKSRTLVIMKWQMPENWTMTDSGIEDGRWPWATIKTDRGDTLKLKHNRSLLDKAEMGGMASLLEDDPNALVKDAHYKYKINVSDEYTDYVETPEQVAPGQFYPVAYSDFQYKGLFGTAYGIRMTTLGGLDPAVVWLECGESKRDHYRPILQKLAGSIEYYNPKDKEDELALDNGGDFNDGDQEMDDEDMEEEAAP